MIKARKISLYTGKGLSKWIVFDSEKQAIDFIESNQSASGAFYWITKTSK